MKPYRIGKIEKYVQTNKIKILDVGIGSSSPNITKKYIPECEYHGIDLRIDKASDDLKYMDKYYEMDLTCLDFKAIPDEYFDLIIMSHVIEHLHNGDLVIEALLVKLKKNGIIYIEFPSFKSTRLPSMRETLNFWDDPTHIRIFSLKELYNLLMKNNFKILKGGTRRSLKNILLVPIKSAIQLMTKGYIRAGIMWDICGFAEFVIAKKK
jgi:2-polyprenyl-3-methyl-5-hydroxy-6-metoxy-1,4-benzoquinol methylase